MAKRTAPSHHQSSRSSFSGNDKDDEHHQKKKSKNHHPSGLSESASDPATATTPASFTATAPTSASPSAPSLRITRSAARLAAGTDSPSADPRPSASSPTESQTTSRKRKAPARRSQDATEQQQQPPAPSPPTRRQKRQKVAEAPPAPPAPLSRRRGTRTSTDMSQPGPSSRPSDEISRAPASSSTSRQKSGRNKKTTTQDAAPSNSTPPSQRRQKKRQSKRDSDTTMKETDDQNDDLNEKARDAQDSTVSSSTPSPLHGEGFDYSHGDGLPNEDDEDDGEDDDDDGDDDGDPFQGSLFGARGPMGLQNTLRALSGMMSGMSSRLRDILSNLKMKEDPSVQLIALQEFSDLLLVSNEDNLAGQFSPDPYVKELVTLMQPSEIGEENPEIMLLACRCLANLMEALRGSVANVVYGGAVPILCQKLLDIQFIDLAEQALSTLAKISVDFPASIVREGGLTACLTYLDFFPTSTQRTAVTTAANCCRNLHHDSFPVIRDVMPTLLNVLASSDQKVVEQGCRCVSRVVESFRYKPEKLEELIEPDLLRAVLRLLLPGTTNLIGPHVHTQLLRVLAITAKASPRLSGELLKMNVVDTIYQILTGISPPDDTEDAAIKIDSVHIMQALIHLPREQVFETLNVVCEILPGIPSSALSIPEEHLRAALDSGRGPRHRSSSSAKRSAEKRVDMLKDCQKEIKRFAMILLPTLTDAYSSTVNLGVRQKVLIAQLKMLQHLDPSIIEDALRTVPYASFLAAILSQNDHPTLVVLALQCAKLLFERLENIYQYQFHREGVISEITKLAASAMSSEKGKITEEPAANAENAHQNDHSADEHGHEHGGDESPDEEAADEDHEDREDDDEDDEDHDHDHDDDDESDSDRSSVSHQPIFLTPDAAINDLVTRGAKDFVSQYEAAKGRNMNDQAATILRNLQTLATDIEACFQNGKAGGEEGFKLFERLASSFDGDALESITSSELLNSGIIRVLVDVFGNSKGPSEADARTAFIKAFMGSTASSRATNNASKTATTTPFSVLIHKLHDLLSRTEHFEVITVHHNSSDSNRGNAASMLGKQLRLKLLADDDSDIPRPYKNIMVSIHAIATFKALDDYLRPRISLSERPRNSRYREALSHLTSAARLQGFPGGRGGDPGAANTGSSGAPPPPPFPNDLPIPDGAMSARSARLAARNGPPAPPPAGGQPPLSGASQEGPFGTRSGRRHPLPPPSADAQGDDPLECADERHLTDGDDDEGMDEDEDERDHDDEDDEDDEDAALNAVVDDLEDDMSEDGVADPTAVNMEVAATGKVTARKEDGTRISTPQQLTPSSKPTSSSTPGSSSQMPGGSSLALSGRPFSYAAAMASIPQDWHIEFSVDDKPISSETTVYRAVHQSREQIDESSSRNVWSGVHTIKYRRVRGPPPPEPSTLTPKTEESSSEDTDPSGMPKSLVKNPTTAAILRLLSILHETNAHLDDILAESKDQIHVTTEPLAQFINTKLTAKLNRQLEEPLIVASGCLPDWSEDLACKFPFLFPFETRHLFLQSTSFGYSRSMARWQNSQNGDDNRRDQRRDERPFLGRLQRQKVRIARPRILESAVKVMEMYGSSPSVLEVEYFDEVGTGLGPTLEFYSTVSKEFSKKKLKLWRENESHNEKDEYAFGKLGLFPAPMSEEQASQESGKGQLKLFGVLGEFVARSMLDSRIIDISFNPTFFRIGDGSSTVSPSLGTVKAVDRDLANSLLLLKQFANAKKGVEDRSDLSSTEKQQAISEIEINGARVEDLSLDFTLPGYPSIELIKDGSNVPVTIDNVNLYVDRVIDLTLGSGVQRQVDAFRAGFSQVFRYSALRAFTPNELVMLFGRIEEDWSIETLMDSIKADHGFNMDSRSVRNLLQTMSELTKSQRRDFLQFVTGSPKLPIGGFKNLTPMFTVVCRPSEPPYTPDDYLPSVMTCVNYLKLPDYTDQDVLRKRLSVAIKEGQGAFHLS
ncbi:Ubiquitin fusion degradation protein 4 [Arachnomyces sp. PD_36]|nr:Ubiquitin fusion degradation protein 4 [Arachnomyces sp. PD_36]